MISMLRKTYWREMVASFLIFIYFLELCFCGNHGPPFPGLVLGFFFTWADCGVDKDLLPCLVGH